MSFCDEVERINCELDTNGEEVVAAYFEVQSRHLFRRTKENYKTN
jgi:hypothetical protein